MSAIAMPIPTLGLGPYASDRAISPEAQRLRNAHWKARDVGQSASISIEEPYSRTAAAIVNAAQEANRPNWDAHNGLPVTQGTLIQAFALLDLLPSALAEPEVAVHPDGEIAFEWMFGARRFLSASINESGRISFAALMGHSRLHGTEYLLDALPEPLAYALRQLHNAAA